MPDDATESVAKPSTCMPQLQPLCSAALVPNVRVQIVKNELGGSATHQEMRGWGGWGHNGMDRGTGGLNPPTPRQFEP